MRQKEKTLDIFEPATREWFHKTLGTPTKVQTLAWPAIAANDNVLVSAPTGTGKTLSAFLVFIDRLKQMAREHTLQEQTYIIYISPLKSLATDIRENLKRPLLGITEQEETDGLTTIGQVTTGIRTGDTTASERRKMIKHPPHILITTPESLYLLLTSKSGKGILKTATSVIIDELHAVIDTKRGAHLMLSLARLDKLCDHPLQRIGLSATIQPLEIAAGYLSPDSVTIVAPKMSKKVQFDITSPRMDSEAIRKSPIWDDLAQTVVAHCEGKRSVIAFVEGRRYAEKLAYYVNQIAGENFARTHHGSLSKEQRAKVEQSLRNGELKLLCATSSMELGIDVGEIDEVLQIGCPRSISSTLQRLGRAGHNPGRTSIMYLFPRTASEGLYCGMTAKVAKSGGVEACHPPKMCFDVLSQHLVSMATDEGYSVEDVMDILKRAYPFYEVTAKDVRSILCMLAGDYEHNREIPVRPRVLYDRINDCVLGDAYSRMLAVSAAGTIPDRGLYTARSESGVKLGELDEEFVYESRIGDRFLLGSFAWKIEAIQKDTVIVSQTRTASARLPFWKGEIKGRGLQTGLAFGKIFRQLSQALDVKEMQKELSDLGLDQNCAIQAAAFLQRQMDSTGVLPDDQTIVIEHFKDETGNYQVMVHSVFGRQVNEPLAMLANETAKRMTDRTIAYTAEDDGFLLFPYDGMDLPEGILYSIDPVKAEQVIAAMLLSTPVFNICFRDNIGRALLTGMTNHSRQPLWVQRMRSAEMLDSLIHTPTHPMIRETMRECLNDYWNIPGTLVILKRILAGTIKVREIYQEIPSPMSLPLRQQTEAQMMYDYAPSTTGIQNASMQKLDSMNGIEPETKLLSQAAQRERQPQSEEELHTMLMTEGDFFADELEVTVDWIENLLGGGRISYIEPGLWIAAEHQDEYQQMQDDVKACSHIIRRSLRYHGGQSLDELVERYGVSGQTISDAIKYLIENGEIIEKNEVYYHAKLYQRAQKETIRQRRMEAKTLAAANYAAYMARKRSSIGSIKEQLSKAVTQLSYQPYPAAVWESVLFANRTANYRPELLDSLLAQGEILWNMQEDGMITFYPSSETDWETQDCYTQRSENNELCFLTEDQKKLCETLKIRGATFMQNLATVTDQASPQEDLMSLAQAGLVHTDSFLPVRQYLRKDKINKAPLRQRVNARVSALTAGRWELNRPNKTHTIEELIDLVFDQVGIICRETVRYMTWSQALSVLSLWEFTGRARRGYFIEGMSGIQFIREAEYSRMILSLSEMEDTCYWMPAIDPDQCYGKCLMHQEGRAFTSVAGTVVCILRGQCCAVFERQGKTLRIFETDQSEPMLLQFVHDFNEKRFYSGISRLIVKDYPKEAEAALKAAGFLKEITDYVLYRR